MLPPEISLGAAAVTNGTSDDADITTTNGTTLRTMQSMDSAKSLFKGPKMITFDGDQTLYSDGANFEGNPQLANYLYLLLRHGVTLAVVTAAGYEYNTERYEMRLSGLLAYFKSKNLPAEDCERFYLFGGECNFLLKVSEVEWNGLLKCWSIELLTSSLTYATILFFSNSSAPITDCIL